jgi:hypothetical protein
VCAVDIVDPGGQESRPVQAQQPDRAGKILQGGDPNAVATEWLKANPDAAGPWLEGVTTFDGGDAAAAVKTALAG